MKSIFYLLIYFGSGGAYEARGSAAASFQS